MTYLVSYFSRRLLSATLKVHQTAKLAFTVTDKQIHTA